MGIVKVDEILWYSLAQQIVCDDCISEDERNELKEDDIVSENDESDDLVFCDRCKEKLSPQPRILRSVAV